MRFLLISLLAVAPFLSAFAQSTGVLTGTVKDKQTQATLAGITIALAGARNAEQAEQNARAVAIELSKEEIKLINEKLGKLVL